MLEALSRGPAAVISPIYDGPTDDDVTPTTFPVTMHADPTEAAPPSSYMPAKWAKAPLSAPSSEAQPEGSGARLFGYAIAGMIALAITLWLIASS